MATPPPAPPRDSDVSPTFTSKRAGEAPTSASGSRGDDVLFGISIDRSDRKRVILAYASPLLWIFGIMVIGGPYYQVHDRFTDTGNGGVEIANFRGDYRLYTSDPIAGCCVGSQFSAVMVFLFTGAAMCACFLLLTKSESQDVSRRRRLSMAIAVLYLLSSFFSMVAFANYRASNSFEGQDWGGTRHNYGLGFAMAIIMFIILPVPAYLAYLVMIEGQGES